MPKQFPKRISQYRLAVYEFLESEGLDFRDARHRERRKQLKKLLQNLSRATRESTIKDINEKVRKFKASRIKTA